jgi:hypothetical protein
MGFAPKEDMTEFIEKFVSAQRDQGCRRSYEVLIAQSWYRSLPDSCRELLWQWPSRSTYLRQESRLEEMRRLCKESNKSVREKCMPVPKSPQWALSMMQHKILTAVAAAVSETSTRKGIKLVHPKSSKSLRRSD